MNCKINFLMMYGCLILALASLTSAQTYKVIQLGSLGGKNSDAAGINDKGQVVGTSSIHNSGQGRHRHAFLWTDGKGMQDLGTLIYAHSGNGLITAGHMIGEFR